MYFNCKRAPKHHTLRRLWLLLALLLTMTFMSGLDAKRALALPPEPIDAEPREDEPYLPPEDGFDWVRPSRVALAFNAWIPDTFNPYVPGHYDPSYVNPTSFSVRFDGCRTVGEARTGTSSNTYIWTLKGNTITNHTCRFTDTFPAQGTYPVSLKITKSDGSVILNTTTQNVLIKDLLIVALGDSYASGEGAPDVPQVVAPNPIGIGDPIVTQPARWWDERCHRSMFSPSAQAAWLVEKANPHISVTYISFACSGATINRLFYKDVESLTPYDAPHSWDHPIGTGILGPYAGAVPPDPDHPENNQIPSQIDQLTTTLTQNGPARQIDALITDGGGNDINFGGIAGLCTLYYRCPDHPTRTSGGFLHLRDLAQYDIGLLGPRYTALANALNGTNLPITKIYFTEYPDSTRNDNGGFCDEMLYDVIPGWLAPALAIVASNLGVSPPFPPYRIDRDNASASDEVAWAGGTVLPGLNSAVIAATQAHGWTLVDGITDNTANLFSGHGYCATDNWIRRASEAVLMQGPVLPLGLGTTATKGTLHPTARGYRAIAQRIFAKLAPDLLPPPNGPQPTPPTFAAPNLSQSVIGANGWLIGHSAGATCPAGASNCALMQEAVHVDAPASIAGTGLSINGVTASCTVTPTMVNGVICSAQATDAQNYLWSFAFPNDGIFQLEFSVSARNGTASSFGQQVKVDLRDPIATSALSAPTPASGWYQTPVTVTLTGSDGNGSSIQSVQYQLNGANWQIVNGNAISLPINTDGTHTIAYLAKDFAGRQSAAQSLTVKLDQVKPTSNAAVTPTANTAGWHKDNVTVTLSASDTGGSGVQKYVYSATGAQPIANTPVNGGAPTQLMISAEGVTTLTVAATDVAGNVEATKNITIKLDKSAPVVQCAAPDGLWHVNDVSITCSATDGNGSGVTSADASFALTTTVPANTESANATTGSRIVCDLAGNCAPQTGPISGNKIDKKAPVITITTPISAVYMLSQTVAANYACTDGGSGVATCTGTAANGSNIDTTTPGSKTFSVNARDNVGNIMSQTISYKVSYNLNVLFDQAKSHKSGSTVPIKLQLSDAKNVNVSSASIVLNVTGLTQKDTTASSEVADSGNANPDNNFRFDATLNGYIYNLSTKGLATGTWVLNFTVAGDPIPHSVQFDVR